MDRKNLFDRFRPISNWFLFELVRTGLRLVSDRS